MAEEMTLVRPLGESQMTFMRPLKGQISSKKEDEFIDPSIALVPGFTAGKKLEEIGFPRKLVPGELWDYSADELAGGIEHYLGPFANIIPFKEQIEGTKEFFSPDTAIEIASMYAAGKAIPAIARPIANKIRGWLKLPLKPEYVPQINRILVPRQQEEIKAWVDSIPEKAPEIKVETKPEIKPKAPTKGDEALAKILGKPVDEILEKPVQPEFLILEQEYTKALSEEPINLEKIKSLRVAMAHIMPEELKPTQEMYSPTFGKATETTYEKLSKLEKPKPDSKTYWSGEIQSTVIPGGKEFVEKDIIPKSLQLGKGLKDTWDRFVHLTVPRKGVKRDILDKIMEMKGERDKSEFILEQTNKRARNFFDKLPSEERISFMDRIKKGEVQPNETLQQLHDMLRNLDDALGKEILEYNPNMNWIENHFRTLWKVIPGKGEEGFRGIFRKPLEGTKGFFKQHTLDSVTEGLEKGGVLYTDNPVRMFEMHYADAMKYITANKMWESFEELGAREFVKTGEKAPEGFVRLGDRIARVYFKVPQGLVNAGEWWVDEGAGRLLNNFLSRDMIRESSFGRGLMWIKNSTTAAELSFNAFHAVFETLETVSSGLAQGAREIWNVGLLQKNWDAIGKGIKDIITAPFTPWGTARTGTGAIKYIADKQSFLNTAKGASFLKRYPDADALINDLFTAGGKLAMHQDYKINSIQTFRNALVENNYIGAAIRSIPALNEVMMKPLFEVYIPRLKVGMFLKEYSLALSERATDLARGRVTRPEIARTVWDFVENRLGEMNFDNLFWDRTFKSGLQLMIRSVTWKLGNIRAFGRSLPQQALEFASAAKEGRMPRLTQEFAWMWGLGATTAALATVITYTSTGQWPEELIDYIYPKIDKEGNRVSLPTYARDLFSLAHSPIKYIQHSLSGWISRFSEVVQNKDFYGVEVHDKDESWANQRIDDLIHMVPLPFAVSSLERMREEKQPIEKQISGFLGFTKAPFYIEQSVAEQKAMELAASYLPEKPRTKEEFKRYKTIKAYGNELNDRIKQNGSLDDIIERLTDDVKSGKLNIDDIQRVYRRLREPLERRTERLSASDAFQVWELADKKEKERIKTIMVKKIMNLENSPEELKTLLPKIQKFLIEIRGGQQ